MIDIRYPLAILAAVTLLSGIFSGCSQGDPVAGGSGSTTTNGFTAVVVNTKGEPVRNATVHIRPHDYCASVHGIPAPSVPGTIADTTTGVDGSLTFSNLLPDEYTIEFVDEASGQGAIIRSDIAAGPVRAFGGVALAPVGAIRGSLDAALLGSTGTFGVQIYGMERIGYTDSTSGAFLIDNMPPADYALRLTSTDSSFTSFTIDTVAVLPQDTVTINPYHTWLHTAIMLIDNAAAGLAPGDTLFDFPLLLRLSPDNFDFSTAKKKGTDFRVTKRDGSAVPFEQEWWDSASGTAALWILIDTLCGNTPVDTLQLYWGNTRASLVSQPAKVFATASGFSGVWHLNESGGTAQKDATVNNREGTPLRMDGSNDVAGSIGRAQQFKNDSQCIVFPASGVSPAINDTSFTVSMWAKVSEIDTAVQTLITFDNSGYTLLLDTASRWFFYGPTNGTSLDSCSAPYPAVTTWVHLCAIKNGSHLYLYVNGALTDSAPAPVTTPAEVTSESSFRLGSFFNDTGWLYGAIDELRISRRAETALWIRFCYETQKENQAVVRVE